MITGVIKIKEEGDSFTGLFSKAKWSPKLVVLLPSHKSFGFRDVLDDSPSQSKFLHLEGVFVSTWELAKELELINTTMGWSYILQFETTEEYNQWIAYLKSVCEIRKHKSTRQASPVEQEREREPSRLEESAMELGIQLHKVDAE